MTDTGHGGRSETIAGGLPASDETAREFTPIGQSVRRVGGFERVTGAQRYVADIRLADALHVELVHLDCARARIVSVDTAA
jgi:CO/xanthine dehydrogenase Mo-binding subunit